MPNEIDDTNPDLSPDVSDVDILNDDTPEVEPKEKTTKEKTTEESAEDEEEETEEETEESEEDEEEAETEKNVEGSKIRPSIKTMIEKNPEVAKVLKEFPQLRDAYFAEGKYRQLFPSLDDASEAHGKAEALDTFTEFIEEGDSGAILDAIRKDDPEKYKKFVTNFLPSLAEMDKNLFYEVGIPIVNRVIRNLAAIGSKSGGKDGANQVAAAKILAHYLHGEYDIPEDDKRVDPEIEAERKKLEEEKNKFKTERGQEFEDSVQTRTGKALNKFISDGLDPENSLSEFTRNNIVDEVIKRIGKELKNDREHMSKMSKLWKAAESGRFSNDVADRIVIAYLSRAKQLIPEIRSKVKKEATGVVKRGTNGTGKTTRKDTNTGTHSGRSTSSSENDPKKINWRKVSDRDILG